MRKFMMTLLCCLMVAVPAHAHFGMLIPSDDVVEQGERAAVHLDLMFSHPFEMEGMDLVKPAAFGVMNRGQKTDLTGSLKKANKLGHKAWQADFAVKRPGVYTFYMEPQPYWEPAEDCYIIHYTKTICEAYGLEDGWDEELGLRTEIVPLSRPFGLYAGNCFQGIVKMDGKPVPYAEVEVEYYNESKSSQAPNETMITQVVKADANGVFTYVTPRQGWWGFAALNTAPEKFKGKDVELGAVLWVKFYEMN